MAFTEYIFDTEKIRARVLEASANLKKNTGETDFQGFVIRLFRERLAENPLSYRQYGPYWYAVKSILGGYGKATDAMIAEQYRGERDIDTLVMADEFRNLYFRTFIDGNQDFVLDGNSGETWTLFDEDMEAR
jgi:hypothetical protein